jgi:hypothetical protein
MSVIVPRAYRAAIVAEPDRFRRDGLSIFPVSRIVSGG